MSSAVELHTAIKEGDEAAARAILKSDPRLANVINETDSRAITPLHAAAMHGQAEIARLLLEHGASIEAVDGENKATPLNWAAFFGRSSVVKVLIKHGAATNDRNVHGLTPLACALEGIKGAWIQFSDATTKEWQSCADAIREAGGTT